MAKPELENGFTQIANEILEKLVRMHLAPNQWQVLLCIIRKTYGFHKKVDYIANFQIGEATGLGKTVISRCLSGLGEMGLITRKGKYIGFQKDWEKWKGLTFQTPMGLAEESTSGAELAEPLTSTELAEPLTELAEQVTKVSTPVVAQKIKHTTQKKTIYIAYPEFKNVNKMSEEEHHKLIDRFGEEKVKDMVENLSLYIASKGDKYKNHYATILSWEKKDRKEAANGAHRRNNKGRELPTHYRSPEEIYGDKA